MPERLAERVWWTKSQSLLLNIFFHLSGSQSSLLLIHFRYAPPPPPLISKSGSPFFRVNRGPILYGFSAAANANRYSVNISLIKLPLHRIFTEIIYYVFLQFLDWYAAVFSHL